MRFSVNMRTFTKLESKPKEVDTSVFNDSIAEKTKWLPIKYGGPTFKTRKLCQPYPYRIEFTMPLESEIIFSALLIIGASVTLGIVFASAIKYENLLKEPMFAFAALVLGPGLTALGAYMLYIYSRPIVFDKLHGYFWRGYKRPFGRYGTFAGKSLSRIDEIHALQIICEIILYDNYNAPPDYSYELNLVLKDASRINIVDHPEIKIIREEAEILSKFLNVPVWDAS